MLSTAIKVSNCNIKSTNLEKDIVIFLKKYFKVTSPEPNKRLRKKKFIADNNKSPTLLINT